MPQRTLRSGAAADAEEPALDDGDAHDARGQDEGSGRSPAVILLPDRGLVQEDERWAGETDVAGRANATKDVDELVERLEGRDEVQDQHGDRRVAQEREGDRPERSPARLAAIDVA